MEPISRRAALTMGGLGLLSTVVGGAGVWRELSTSSLDPVADASFAEPRVLPSGAGLLDVRLEASRSVHQIAGRQATTLGFNGGVPGPTLRVRPGDTLRIELVNQMEEVTNLHVHGLHVSPEGNSDNIFLTVEPGRSQRYEYRLPDDHPPGVYWYHPHHHGTVADQVFGGLYGAIIVEEADEPAVDRDRVMIVSDMTLDSAGSLIRPSPMERVRGREGDLVLVNGRVAPRLEGRAGDRERWRLVNACTSRYLSLALLGQSARAVGRDVGRLAEPVPLEDVVLAPGNRLDVIVDLHEGTSELTSRPVDRGGATGGMMHGGPSAGDRGPATLVRVRAAAGGAVRSDAVPRASARPDLRGADVSGRRSITLRMGMTGMMGGGSPMSFTIDGKEFELGRIDQRVRRRAVEEWTIHNDSPLDHPFHLHVWPMQLLEVDGRVTRDPVWLDVVNVPARGQVTVRVAFDDFVGRTVYHCHILDHEDLGMMGTVLAE